MVSPLHIYFLCENSTDIFALVQGMHPVHIGATQNPRPDNTSKRKDVGAQEDVGGVEL